MAVTSKAITAAPASQQRSGSSGKPCTEVYHGRCGRDAVPGGEHEFAHVPAMPTLVTQEVEEHRTKGSGPRQAFNAAVARPVGAKEIASTPRAQESLDAEWARLRAVPRPDGKKGCWDEDQVCEWQDIKRAAALSGGKAHIGRIFAICVEKNSELEPENGNIRAEPCSEATMYAMRVAIGPSFKTWGRVQQQWMRLEPVMPSGVCQDTPPNSATQSRHTHKLCCAALRLGSVFQRTNGQIRGPA